MTLSNNQIISVQEKEAIAETVHETLSEFRDEIKQNLNTDDIAYTDILEGSCFYYAALGTDICTKIYQHKFDDTVSCYTLQAGSFKLWTDFGSFFEYKGDSHNQNNYHCWIAGPVPRKDNGKFEIIDFTVRHYKAQVDKISSLRWEREDLEGINFIWTDDLDDLSLEKGLRFHPDDSITRTVYFEWQDSPLRIPMLEKSEEILSYKLASVID